MKLYVVFQFSTKVFQSILGYTIISGANWRKKSFEGLKKLKLDILSSLLFFIFQGHFDKGGKHHKKHHHEKHHKGDFKKGKKGITGHKKGKKGHIHKGHKHKVRFNIYISFLIYLCICLLCQLWFIIKKSYGVYKILDWIHLVEIITRNLL